VEKNSADEKLFKVDKRCQQKLFIFPKKVNLQPFKNNLLAAVEVKSADKTERRWKVQKSGGALPPLLPAPLSNDTKVLKYNKFQNMS